MQTSYGLHSETSGTEPVPEAPRSHATLETIASLTGDTQQYPAPLYLGEDRLFKSHIRLLFWILSPPVQSYRKTNLLSAWYLTLLV